LKLRIVLNRVKNLYKMYERMRCNSGGRDSLFVQLS
jgi:hypothetical protein